MGIWDQRTKFVNKTGLRIDFVVEDGTICPLRGLPAGKSRSVSLSLIRKHCWERGSADWLIRVLINDHFCGIHLHPRHHILMMTRIVFRYDWRSDGSSTLIAEGVEENVCDRIFGCCIKWDKRNYVEIGRANSTRTSIREDVDDVAAPLIVTANSLQSRPAAARTIVIASPTINRIRRLNGGHIMFTYFLLFYFALTSVAALRFFHRLRF